MARTPAQAEAPAVETAPEHTKSEATAADRPAEKPAAHPFETLRIVRGAPFLPAVHPTVRGIVDNTFNGHPIFVHTTDVAAQDIKDLIRDVRRHAKAKGKPITVKQGTDRDGNPGVQFSSTTELVQG